MSTPFKYLQGYPPHLQQQVMQMVSEDRLGDYLARRYPNRHQVQSDKALYGYTVELKQEYLRSAPAIDKVLYDNRLDLTHRALGLHTAVSRVQGGKLKTKREIRVANLFREAPPEFLRMIVVHELAHLKERRARQGLLPAVLVHGAGLPPAGVRPAPVPDLARPAGRLKALDENRTARCRARRACAAWTVPRLIHRVIPGLCAQPFESNRY